MNRVNVLYHSYGEHRLVGMLMMDGHQPIFQYSASWLDNSLPLFPLKLSVSQDLYHDDVTE